MGEIKNLSGKYLNELWGVSAKHALYRADGKWYHNLEEFPGALFDANGYVVFKTEEEYRNSEHLQIRQDLHVIGGISSMPTYIRITEQAQLQTISHTIKKVSENQNIYKVPKKQESKIRSKPHGQNTPKYSSTQRDQIIRDTKVSLWVKYIHEYKCQFCGTALQISTNEFYAEAHHIKPLGNGHNGPDVVENVLCVCPNHHALLDLFAIPIDVTKLSHVEGHEINPEYIDYHNSRVMKKHPSKKS